MITFMAKKNHVNPTPHPTIFFFIKYKPGNTCLNYHNCKKKYFEINQQRKESFNIEVSSSHRWRNG